MRSTLHDVTDLSLAAAGQLRIDGGDVSMPVLRQGRERCATHQALRNVRIGAHLHVTTETAVPINRNTAGLERASRGVRIDRFTPRQQEHLASWTHGT